MHSMILRPRRSCGPATTPPARRFISARHASTARSSASTGRRSASATQPGYSTPHSISGQAAPACQYPQNENQQVRVRIPIDNVHREIYVPTNIMIGAFLSGLCTEMKLHTPVARFGWRTSEESQSTPPRELKTQAQLQGAIQDVLRLQGGGQQCKTIALVIVHLNYYGLAYQSQILLLEKNLSCARHPYRWCYIKPGTEMADDHLGLGEAELHLWAKRMYDGLADPMGRVPPDCFDWWKPHPRPVVTYGGIIGKQTIGDHDDNTEALLLEHVFRTLDERYPRLNFSQYQDRLYQQGIIYAVNALHFGPEYYIAFGMNEGSIGVFLEEVQRAVENDNVERTSVARELSVAMSVEI